ncbi:MAG: hypothetical protein SOU19_09645 [Candidatus Caccosoma sp.]|nr:hypothetical protein [Candidatus Caccosoma sp.]
MIINFTLFDFLKNNWLYILACLLFVIIILLFFIFISTNVKKEKTFKDSLIASKTINMSIVIDFEEKTVEKYYPYDANHKTEMVSLDEFFVSFDKVNAEKFKTWLDHISRVSSFNKTRHVEIVMYDNDSKRKVYLVELNNYISENKKYFLYFKDITDSITLFRRLDKIAVYADNEDFYKKINEILQVSDSNANNYLVAFKYKEYAYCEKELQRDFIQLINDRIFNRLFKAKFENEQLCISQNGVFLMFSSNISNIKKYKQHLRKMINECSGAYDVIKNKFQYSINLVAGYTSVNKNETITVDKALEAEVAVNSLIETNRFYEKIQLFDEHLKGTHTILNNKLLAVERVVNEELFSLTYTPIIKIETKEVCGYKVDVNLPSSLKMDLNEFNELVKQRLLRTVFYLKIFEMILKRNDFTTPYYLSFDFDNLSRVIKAFQIKSDYSKINFFFSVEFSNALMQHADFVSIEKQILSYKKMDNIKFGITYNNFTSLYLNDKIYFNIDFIILSGQLVEQALDKYKYESLIDMYVKLALSYKQDIVALNVKSVALYEFLVHNQVKKIGGSYLTPYVINNKIVDKYLLENLNNLESKEY